ncbi:AMP-binding enzyme [Halomonadaceae bacterium KBTZ08]
MVLGDNTLLAVLSHLIGSELAGERGLRTGDLVTMAAAGGSLRDGPLAVDSIEQLSLARVVNEFFELEASGVDEWLLRREHVEDWVALIQQGMAEGATHIGFRSGGSTGEPRLNRCSRPHLASEADLIASHFPHQRRIIGIAPPHHIYGFLWGPLLADRLGVPYLHGDDAHQQGLDPHPGDLVVAFPEWWRYRSGRRTPFAQNVAGVTSTAPCPASVIRALKDQGLASMTEVYGSSETGAIGWRDDPEAPFSLLAHWERVGGVEEDTLYLRPLDTTVAVPDRLNWHDERRITPAGRRDGTLQVAGTNVDPAAIAEAIKDQEGVADCTVRPFEAPNGTRLKAFIVPGAEADEAVLEQDLRQWVNHHLTTPERPVRFDFGMALPRNELGKLCDW